MIVSHFSGEISRRGSKDSTPALVTRMPTGPSSARDASEGRFDRRPVGDVDLDGENPNALGCELGCRRLGTTAVPIEDGDVVAVRNELAGNAEPDAGRTARDHGDAHRATSPGVNSRCRELRPRSTHVGSYR